MLDVEGGAQQDRFPGGTQQIALRMAEELGPAWCWMRWRAASNGTPTAPLTVGSRSRRRHGEGRHRRRPTSTPGRASRSIRPLPPEYEKLAQHWPQGNLSKAYVAYETPFWRADGRSGEALSDEGPVFITFDVSPSDADPGILLGFTDARTFDALPAAQRREQSTGGVRLHFR